MQGKKNEEENFIGVSKRESSQKDSASRYKTSILIFVTILVLASSVTV